MIEEAISRLESEFGAELRRVAHWWVEKSPDSYNGGFYGEIDAQGKPAEGADKSIILNTRILWFFSELSCHQFHYQYVELAHRAYEYLIEYFEDKKNGGVYWLLDAKGEVVDSKKQVYAQTFAIYALCSYYRLTKKREVLFRARKLQDLLETYAWDDKFGGYLDAFDKNWHEITETCLGDADENAAKKMNTHLHLLEAYSAMHSVAQSERTEKLLEKSIRCYCDHFIDRDYFHLNMFFDKRWVGQSSWFSLGHEIESSWLLDEAIVTLGNSEIQQRYHGLVDGMAKRCLNLGFGFWGEFQDEYRDEQGFNGAHLWWVQAEAIVGFLNAYQNGGDIAYFCAFDRVWQFVKCTQLDLENGEWMWFSRLNKTGDSPYKAGAWKGPYHNGRALMEVLKRLEHLKESISEYTSLMHA